MLDPLEAAMLTADRWNPLNIGALLILRTPPHASRDYVDGVFHELLQRGPADDVLLRRHPYRGVETIGTWVWREDGPIDPARHLIRIALPASADRDELWRLVGGLHALPLETSDPMWRMYVIDGFDDNRFAVYFKAHHAVVDGMDGMRLIADALTADSRTHPTGASDPDDMNRLPVAAITRPSALAQTAEVVASVAGAGRSLVSDVLAVTKAAATRNISAWPAAAPLAAFNTRLGTSRVVTGACCTRARIVGVQRRASVSSGDVVTAVIAGAVRRWLLEQGELPKRSLVAICPITGSRRDYAPNSSRSNTFGAWLCPLATDVADDARRLDRIHRAMASGKRIVETRGAAASLLALSPSIATTVLAPLIPGVPRWRAGYNLPISHVRGPSTPRFWNGALVEHIFPVSAVFAGQGVNVTTCTYSDHVDFGFVAGGAGATEVRRLAALIETSMQGLESALRLSTGPSAAQLVT